jgi:uncharacterized protein YwgA
LGLVEILRQIEAKPYHWPTGRTIFQKIAYVATREGLPTGFHYERGSFGPFSKDLKNAETKLSSVTMCSLLSGYPIELALSIASVAAGRSVASLTWTEWLGSNEGLNELAAMLLEKNVIHTLVRRIEPTEGDGDE